MKSMNDLQAQLAAMTGKSEGAKPVSQQPVKASQTISQPVTKPVSQPVADIKFTATDLLAKYRAQRDTLAAKPDASLAISKARAVTNSPIKLPLVAATVPQLAETSQAPLVIPNDLVIPSELEAATTILAARVEKHEITYDLLNAEQKQAVAMATEGKSFCLIGSAGTGKTTTQRIVLEYLAESGAIRRLANFEHRTLPRNLYSIVVCSYMNKAVNNIRATLPNQFKSNAITIHKFLEYSPVMETREYIDELTGQLEEREVKVFKPNRHKNNTSEGLTHAVFEEGSTIQCDLHQEFMDALPDGGASLCEIYLGDLKQLPPVFGSPILGVKLQELPYVELTEVHRTALDSPITKFAIELNKGQPISDKDLQANFADGAALKFMPFSNAKKPRASGESLVDSLVMHYAELLDAGTFVPFRDIILCPYRVNRTDNINCEYINLHLAEHQGIKNELEVHEVIAGFAKKYLAVGDPVLYAKEDYKIIAITEDAKYKGFPPKFPSTALSRLGYYREGELAKASKEFDLEAKNTESTLALSLADMQDLAGDEDPTVRSASHTITLEYQTTDPEAQKTIVVDTISDLIDLDFAYALTVHKSIGSEWDSVFFIAHHSHLRMLTRELFYTACTRAKNHLSVYYDPAVTKGFNAADSTINYAITHPAIKGITIEEKLEFLANKARIAKEDNKSPEDMLAKFVKAS